MTAVGADGAVTVVGGGVAGVSTVSALRRLGHTGRLLLVDAGAALHDRPPLSKGYLSGRLGDDELGLLPTGWFTEHDVEVRQGVRAVALDPGSATVGLSDGDVLDADAVVLAQGATAHRPPLPGVGLAAVLRTLDDARGLRPRLRPGAHLVVVGAGLVGAEVTATARSLGVHVVLVDPDPLPLADVVGPDVARLLHADHDRHGVDVVQQAVRAVTPGDGAALRVELADGSARPADAVLVATGMVPADDLARLSGLQVAPGGGVVVDDAQRTSAPLVLAVGDGTRRRAADGSVEPPGGHWDAARLDGDTAAATLLGLPAPERGAPWFWTDRYERHVEVVGRPANAARTLVRGVLGEGPAAVLGWTDGVLTGAVAVDDPRSARALRRLVDRRVPVDPDVVVAAGTDLRALLRGPDRA
ncbi:NAD(P)/FAD-dependent oxidoreductase [Jannaschia sp. R86511]|uniref:NAD(P)/FAD-dependent oxidoreductase n=1 Tax=Jannaschia sp. R86511 TaxID=3093853 RepID=UPI0036D383C6